MKRKKWSEQEEQTLLTKYSELLNSGALAKLKTREKKFKPIADHVNAAHHVSDPVAFPFQWSWRDVSIKVQNMRHQYLGVKQKIRISDDEFNWKDGENHWENFLKYKEVFGDVELESKGKRLLCENVDVFGYCGDLGVEIDCEDSEEEEGEEEEEEEEELEEEDGDGDGGSINTDIGEVGEEIKESDGELGDLGFGMTGKSKKNKKKGLGVMRRLGLVGAGVLELRDVMMKREERRREREFRREKGEEKREEGEFRKEKRRIEQEDWLDNREFELEERHSRWAKREFERRVRLEREFAEERRRRMRVEEKREEEEMEWRERMVGLQIEHEKQMMQMQAEACQNQIQVLGMMARFVCQFFGSANDGLGGGLGSLPPQILQNLQHPGELGDNGKPDANSPSEFI
ncbi:hypothetical protein L484_027213 [Morus notabilis]|uniref:Uncharacterized protein n=1 Tax=Morus notabilis TaxID=981085 RepID=W9SQE5_9ROSA|nr:stress response protein NST1 [Morus notabilis]XP_024029632.1 stress response protein NST1 [Morus notabilis]EXC20655.1 hypothetical protein L484_027213 [Morus notabilis]